MPLAGRFAPGACSEECEDANRCWTSSDSYVLNGLGMSDGEGARAARDLTSLRAVLLDIPASQGLDVAQRIGKHVEHQLERAIDSLFGIDGFLDALGANLGEP